MRQVNIEEAKVNLLDLVNAVLEGETVVILKAPQEAVKLVPAVPPVSRRFGSAKGLITMAEDFDAPLPGFGEYTS